MLANDAVHEAGFDAHGIGWWKQFDTEGSGAEGMQCLFRHPIVCEHFRVREPSIDSSEIDGAALDARQSAVDIRHRRNAGKSLQFVHGHAVLARGVSIENILSRVTIQQLNRRGKENDIGIDAENGLRPGHYKEVEQFQRSRIFLTIREASFPSAGGKVTVHGLIGFLARDNPRIWKMLMERGRAFLRKPAIVNVKRVGSAAK